MKMNLRWVRQALLLCVVGVSVGQGSGSGLWAQPESASGMPEEMRKMMERVNEASREISRRLREAGPTRNPLRDLETLRGLESEYQREPGEVRQILYSMLMGAMAEFGHYEAALRCADLGHGKPMHRAARPSSLEGFEPVDAVEAIVEAAAESRAVLINEAHHVPQHRAFTLRLLKELRERGFTHFAAETLSPLDAQLNVRGYPVKLSGAYINEPVYGDLIRTALRLGYRVVSYEMIPGQSGSREAIQAGNLVDRVFRETPSARLVVHAGYAHIDETGTLAGSRTMAQQLAEKTGFDPLTIDQTVMTERGKRSYEHPLFRSVVDERLISEATVFRNSEGEFWTLERGKRDLTLFHPRSVFEAGRPTWLRLGGIRKPVELEESLLGSRDRCMVEARCVGESEDAVPMDRVELVKGQPLPSLLLPGGKYIVESRSIENELIASFQIESQK